MIKKIIYNNKLTFYINIVLIKLKNICLLIINTSYINKSINSKIKNIIDVKKVPYLYQNYTK